MFALVDVNASYASCKKIIWSDLKGQPVMLLSNKDDCVIA